MLSDLERKEIEEELRNYPLPRAGCLDALKVVQRHRGWVPDEQIADVAEALGMTPDELDGIATFYPFIFRRPVGRHIVAICDGLACWVMGYQKLFEALVERLGVSWGGTTADGRFTLLPISCIGQCDRAPAMMVDEDVYGNLTTEQIGQILEQYK
ncbi:MAG: NADH-quinone oxidoreductase subunit NuoE [Syntrophorhabdales bacterium]|jgi:NADH-quinone oxidoreductase subunit E